MKNGISKKYAILISTPLFSIAIMLSGNVSAAGEKATVEQLKAAVANQATIDAGQNAQINTITSPVRAIGDVLPDGSVVFWVDETVAARHGSTIIRHATKHESVSNNTIIRTSRGRRLAFTNKP